MLRRHHLGDAKERITASASLTAAGTGQLTAVDVPTRIAVVQRVVGDKSAAVAAWFLGPLKYALRKNGITMQGVLIWLY